MSSSAQSLVYHIVAWNFADNLPDVKIKEACAAFVALAETCLDPHGNRYIISIHAGANNSPEDAAGGITHAFILLFKNLSDRDYYVWHDPVHNAFKTYIAPYIQQDGSIRVVDFQDGVM